MSFDSSQVGSQEVTCMNSLSEVSVSFLFLLTIEVSTARASPFVILVNFFCLPLSVAASVLEAYPVVGSSADLKDVHVIEGGYICFRLKAKT